MIHLITGGSGSGKSALAEALAVKAGRERFYIATMEPLGEEGMERVRKHRAMRAGKGFVTIECYGDLGQVHLPEAAGVPGTRCVRPAGPHCRVILLECMSNVVANELFGTGGSDQALIRRIGQGVCCLEKQAQHLVIVTGNVFADGQDYDPETVRYMELLARVNRMLAERADQVTEVVYGIPVSIKGGSI